MSYGRRHRKVPAAGSTFKRSTGGTCNAAFAAPSPSRLHAVFIAASAITRSPRCARTLGVRVGTHASDFQCPSLLVGRLA
jgi:hypothetical protein